MLYLAIRNKLNATKAFDAGKDHYEQMIEFNRKQEQNVELQQLSLLELYVVSESFPKAETYAEVLKDELKSAANRKLLAYLTACAKIGANKAKDVNFNLLESMILEHKKNITSWSYDLFFKWLRLTKIDKAKEVLRRKLTDLIKPVY